MSQTELNLERTSRGYRVTILLGFISFLFVLLANYYFFARFGEPSESYVIFPEDIEYLTPTDVCPKDVIRYHTLMTVTEDVVVQVVESFVRLSDGFEFFAVGGNVQQFVFSGPSTVEITRSWVVPSGYNSFRLGIFVPLVEGRYERRLGVISVGKETKPSILSFPFTVRKDCF